MFMVRLKPVLALFLSLVISFPAFGDAKSCSPFLSNAQITALREAGKGDYIVKTVKVDIDGVERTVVVLGETHVKGKADAELGKNVVDQFENVGVEGAEGFKKSILGYALGSIAMGVYKIAEAFGLHPSTIKYAVEKAKDPNANIRVENLEAGHRLTLKDNFKLAVMIGTMIPTVARAGFYLTPAVCGVADSIITFEWIGAALATLWLLKIVPLTEMVVQGAAQITGYATFTEDLRNDVLCGTRDPYMAAAIENRFHQEPDLKNILVIVGSAHVWGVINNLKGAKLQTDLD